MKIRENNIAKHILVTTCLSESAESAFEYAKKQFKLAGTKKSKIALLKVIDVVPLAGIQIEYGLEIADKNRMKLHKQASN